MGSSSSKAVGKTASKLSASTTARKYPSRTPPNSGSKNAQTRSPNHETTAGPTVHPATQTSSSHDQTIADDASDPDLTLQARLRAIGPVQPNPTRSAPSTASTTFSTAAPLPRNTNNPRPPPHATPPPSPAAPFQFQPSASSPAQTIFPPASASPAQHPAVSLLTARYRLAEQADAEFARMGRASARREGRQFLDVVTLRQVLVMREQGRSAGEIERGLGLREGVVGRLGRRGVIGVGG